MKKLNKKQKRALRALGKPTIGHNRGPDFWRELAEKAAHDLNGTCKTIAELGEEYEGALDNSDFCARLDELALECEVCNWWDEPSEMADTEHRIICLECFEEEGDND